MFCSVPGRRIETKDADREGFNVRGGGEAVHEPGGPSGGRIERDGALEVGASERRMCR